jgi:hypothetical protein
MSSRIRNALIVLAGFVALGLVIGLINRSTDHEAAASPPQAMVETPTDTAAPTRPPKIFRMEAPLEELRKLPVLDGMTRADELARKALPQGVETPGQWVQADEVLEGYAHPNGQRFMIIMKPGTRAYSVFLDHVP